MRRNVVGEEDDHVLRIGFLDGAVNPQRETKVSVFTPWDDKSYVVVDVPEALWSNLGLTYLAHTHVPTIWSKQGIELERLEWNRRKDGSLDLLRRLPNGIEFGALVVPQRDAVRSGAYVGSNSWGDDTQGRYDLSAAEFDALVRDADAEGCRVDERLGGEEGRRIVMVGASNGGNLADLRVKSLMVADPVCGSPDDSIDQLREVMTQNHVRYLPVR